MNAITRTAIAAAMLGLAASGGALAQDVRITLSGQNEVPPVTTKASGEGMITIADDGAVGGSVTTKDIQGTAAHIHLGAPGTNGPVIVPFVKDGDTFKPAAGAKLNAEQMKAFQDGKLYFNVHSAAHPGGEIRAQLK